MKAIQNIHQVIITISRALNTWSGLLCGDIIAKFSYTQEPKFSTTET